jgi:hypothetical protein
MNLFMRASLVVGLALLSVASASAEKVRVYEPQGPRPA